MKNTLAIGVILLGGLMVYAGYQNWTLADTIRFFAGQKQTHIRPGVVGGTATDGTGLDHSTKGYHWVLPGGTDSHGFHNTSPDDVLAPDNPDDPNTPPIPADDPRNATGKR